MPDFEEFYNIKHPDRLSKTISGELKHLDDWYDTRLDRFLHSFSKSIRPDAVIAEYAVTSRSLECFGPNILKLLDTIDVFADRNKKLLAHGIFPLNTASLKTSQEKKALDRADIVMAIQDDDKAYFSKLTAKRVVTVRHWLPLYAPVIKRTSRHNILFIGGDTQSSRKSVEFFMHDIFPLIRVKNPKAQFIIAGKVCPLISKVKSPCFKIGPLKNLEKIYGNSDVVINAEVFATGSSTKNLTALSHSKPLVTTPIGARGMENGAAKAFLISRSPRDFANKVLDVLDDHDLAKQLSLQAYEYAKRNNEKAVHALRTIFC